MEHDPLPPRYERPAWKKPRLFVVGAGALAFVLGLLDPLVPEAGDLPGLLRAAFVLVPLVIALVWAGPNAWSEATVAIDRIRSHGRLYDRMEWEMNRANAAEHRAVREQTRSATLSILLTASAVHQTRFRSCRFAISMPRIEDGDLVVTIRTTDPISVSVPYPGERLLVVDPEDGRWQGEIESLEHRSLGGERLARIVDGDTLWLSFLLQKAATREAYQANAVAIYVTDAEGADHG